MCFDNRLLRHICSISIEDQQWRVFSLKIILTQMGFQVKATICQHHGVDYFNRSHYHSRLAVWVNDCCLTTPRESFDFYDVWMQSYMLYDPPSLFQCMDACWMDEQNRVILSRMRKPFWILYDVSNLFKEASCNNIQSWTGENETDVFSSLQCDTIYVNDRSFWSVQIKKHYFH